MRKEQKKQNKQLKQQQKSKYDETMVVIMQTVLVVVLSIVILRCNEIDIYQQLDYTRKNAKEAAIKDIVPAPISEEEELPCESKEDENKNELILGVARLFPKKNDSKVTGKSVYKEFEHDERHAAKLTFYYGNYKFAYNYVDGGSDYSSITIMDKKTGKVLYVNDHLKTIIFDNEYNPYDTLPTISGGKLHLLRYNPDKCYVDGYGDLSPYLDYVQINLSGSNIKEKTILSIKGYEFGATPACY